MINQYIEGIFGQMRGNSMKNEKDVLILAIESSCDETAAAVVKNGRTVLSNVINTQIAIHTEYGAKSSGVFCISALYQSFRWGSHAINV